MITGMTNKQFARTRFLKLVEKYRAALRAGDSHEVVCLSLALHAAKAAVPKRMWPLVSRAFREEYKTTTGTEFHGAVAD